MSLDAVLKIGGSLSRGEGLPALCAEISLLGKTHPLLVVPGGGNFADHVRDADRRFELSATAGHRMALLAMDQYAYVLNHLIAGSCLTPDPVLACESAQNGKTAILLPSALLMNEDPLPHSWSVTSDSIAAWLCNRLNCRLLILVKDVDGLLGPGGRIHQMTAQQLSDLSGGVDEYLSKVLSSAQLDTWIVNGMHPERVAELLGMGCTTGTRISSK